MKTYSYHNDAGHGWIEVKRSELEALGIADQISSYSYQEGDGVYLEEDCDAAKFELALGHKIKTVDVWEGDNSPIREFQRYQA